MFGRGSPREHTFTNQTLSQVLTKDDEHLANMVSAEASASLSCFVSTHVSTDESRTYSLVTSVPPLNSTAERQLNQQLEFAAVRTLRHQHSPG